MDDIEILYGLLFHCDSGKKQGTRKVPLRDIKNKVSINGLVASVESVLHYQNNEDTPIETEFVFPLDSQSAVYKFEAEIAGKKITAECQEKQQAKETYEDAIATGHTAMYIGEDKSGDTFRLKLGNLPAKAEATLTLGYVIELNIEVGVVKFSLPTILNPRYTPVPQTEDVDPMDTAQQADDETSPTDNAEIMAQKSMEAPPLSTSPDKIPYSMSLSAVISGGYRIQNITSVRDVLDVQVDPDRKKAKLELSSKFKFDHDIELSISYEDFDKPEFVLEKGLPDKDGLLKEDLLMLNFVPKVSQVADAQCEFVFVIDRSGSMHGDRIQRAKETLLLLLKSLPVACKFNIVSFGSSHNSLFPKSVEYNQENLQRALELQKEMDADMGGTEILKPLQFIYSQKVDSKFQRQIFLLTDGEVSNVQEVIDIARKNAKTTRVFTFGIGSGSSTELVKGVARVSKGKATFIKDNEQFQPKVLSMLQCSTQPAITDLSLSWDLPDQCKALSIPSEVGPVFNGEKLILYALIKRDEESPVTHHRSSLKLKGNIGERQIEHKMNFDLLTSSADEGSNLPIHRLAAKSQIKELEDSEEGKSHKDNIILVSLAANVISRYTAFVGIDKESNVPVDNRQAIDVPHPYDLEYGLYCSASLGGHNLKSCSLAAGGFDVQDQYSSEGSESDSDMDAHPRKNYRSPVQYKRASRGASMPSFGGFFSGLFGKKNKKKSKPAPARSADVMALGTDQSNDMMGSNFDSFEEMPVSAPRSAPQSAQSGQLPVPPGDAMLELISLQSFNGFWELHSSLADILKKELKHLTEKNPVKSNSVWATILAITFLAKNHQKRKVEWAMIEQKAVVWIQTQDLEGKTLEDLRNAAESVIS